MARNVFIDIVKNVSIDANGTKSIYLDLAEAENIQFLSQVKTVGASGVTLDLYYGFGSGDPTATGSIPTLIDVAPAGVLFGDTKTSISVEAASAGVTKGTVFFLNSIRNSYPRWIKLLYTNTDGSNAATLSLYGDL